MELLYRNKDKTIGENGYSHDGVYLRLVEIRMKSPESGKWYDAIVYKNIESGGVYVREKNDFYNKFEHFETQTIWKENF